MFNFIYVDKKDGTGGFMIPNSTGTKDLVDELLKNPEYIIRKECTVEK